MIDHCIIPRIPPAGKPQNHPAQAKIPPVSPVRRGGTPGGPPDPPRRPPAAPSCGGGPCRPPRRISPSAGEKLLYTFGKSCAILNYVWAGACVPGPPPRALPGPGGLPRAAPRRPAAPLGAAPGGPFRPPPCFGFFAPRPWERDEIPADAPSRGRRHPFYTQPRYIAGGTAPGPTKRGGPAGAGASRLFVLRLFPSFFEGILRFLIKECHLIWQKK